MDATPTTNPRRSRLVLLAVTAAVVAFAMGTSTADATNIHELHSPPGIGLTDADNVAPTAETDTWAVIIGIDTYPGDDDLAVAVNDAHDLDRALAETGIPSDHRLVITDHDATAANITKAITWLTTHAEPNDQAILAYAGHVDTTTATTQSIRTADNQHLTDTTLAQLLEPLQAPTWLIFASCYSAGFDELLTPNRTLTAAAPADQLAYENLDLGNSYLIHALTNSIDDTRNPTAIATRAIAAVEAEYSTRTPVHIEG